MDDLGGIYPLFLETPICFLKEHTHTHIFEGESSWSFLGGMVFLKKKTPFFFIGKIEVEIVKHHLKKNIQYAYTTKIIWKIQMLYKWELVNRYWNYKLDRFCR